MAINPNRDAKQKSDMRFDIFLTFMISIYAGMYLGAEAAFYESQGTNFGENIFNVVSDFYTMIPLEKPVHILNFVIKEIPGALRLLPTKIAWVGAAAMVAGFISLDYYVRYLLNRNMRPGEEHGSSAFSLDYNTLTHDYIMSAVILKEGFMGGNIKVSIIDRIRLKLFYWISAKKTLKKRLKEKEEEQKEIEAENTESVDELIKEQRKQNMTLEDGILDGKRDQDAVR